MTPPKILGLVAGNGIFPRLFIEAAHARNIEVIAVAMRGETDPVINTLLPDVRWVRVGQLGKMIRHLRQAGVSSAAMAGGVKKTKLFSGARPDLTAMRLLSRTMLRRDDSMLRAVAGEFERNGIEIIDCKKIAKTTSCIHPHETSTPALFKSAHLYTAFLHLEKRS